MSIEEKKLDDEKSVIHKRAKLNFTRYQSPILAVSSQSKINTYQFGGWRLIVAVIVSSLFDELTNKNDDDNTGRVQVYFSVEDAVALGIYMRLREILRASCVSLTLPAWCSIDEVWLYRFPFLSYSTFGVPVSSEADSHGAAHEKVLGLTSLDGRTIPCGSCGGLFEPDSKTLVPDLSDLPGINHASPYESDDDNKFKDDEFDEDAYVEMFRNMGAYDNFTPF